jgi:hypothetical protein
MMATMATLAGFSAACAFRRIRPPIPTTSAHLYRWGGRPLRNRNVPRWRYETATGRRPWAKLAQLGLISRRMFFHAH